MGLVSFSRIKIVGRAPVLQSAFRSAVLVDIGKVKVRGDPKLPGDSGEVPIAEWSGWRFDSCSEVFSLR